MTDQPVQAAGAVVWRSVGDREQVLLVHRDRYDDWTFPKGKLDPGEVPVAAAVREVEEETGVRVRLGPRLSLQEYVMTGPPGAVKQVTYWSARPVNTAAETAAETYQPNAEIDGVLWVDADAAADRLTYARDAVVLEEFVRAVGARLHRSSPLVILRHARAKPRKTWRGDDRKRPLDPAGHAQAERLVPMLRAFDVRVAVSSDAVRCQQTLGPAAKSSAGRGEPMRLELARHLSEESSSRRKVRETVRGLLTGKQRTVLCTHRPVLPLVFDALDIDPLKLEPGQLLVVHRHGGRVLDVELLMP